MEWGGDIYQRDMFVTGFQVSAVAMNACHQRLLQCTIPIRQDQISAFKILKAGEVTALNDVLGDENCTDAELMETGRLFFTAMYGQPEGTSMSLARYNLYTRKKGKPLRIIALPPTEKICCFT